MGRLRRPIAAHHEYGRPTCTNIVFATEKFLTPNSCFARVQCPWGWVPVGANGRDRVESAGGLVVQDFPTKPPSGPYKSTRPRPALAATLLSVSVFLGSDLTRPRSSRALAGTLLPPLTLIPMAVSVASRRKRGPDAFLDDPFAFPSDPTPLAKRGRCSPSGVAAADLGLSFPLDFDPIDALRLIFPDEDPQVLRDYFEASGNVLDAAITTFKEHMANRNTESPSPLDHAPAGNRTDLVTSSEVDVPVFTIPTSGSEWAELVVKEMSSASDLVDAKKRALGMLELFQKSTVGSDSKSIQEHKVVKQMLGSLLHQNSVLKRAFLIQHNRLKDYEEMVQERSQFKQIIEKYQEQIKALENKNYFLSFHLQQANQHSSISSYRNPDVC